MSSYGVVTVSYSVRVVCMLLVTWCTDCRQTVDTAIKFLFAVMFGSFEPCQVHSVFSQPFTFRKYPVAISVYKHIHLCTCTCHVIV